jgi:hypothetical protein
MKSKYAIAAQKRDQQFVAVDRRRNRVEEILQQCQIRELGERNTIAHFLMEHRFLVPVILEAMLRIRRIFGDEAVIFLALIVDPEDEDFEELLISIVTDRPTEKALDLLDRFDEEWFMEVLPQTKNLLNVTVEGKHAL